MKSWLFSPASRLDLVVEFASVGADVGVLDLADAGPVETIKAVRRSLADSRAALADRSLPLLVRVNGLDSGEFDADLVAVARSGVDGVVVPKLTSADDVDRVRAGLAGVGLDDCQMVGGLETAAGVIQAAAICAAGLDAVYFGADDYVADLGGRRTTRNHEVETARSMVAMAAAAARIGAVDQAVVDLGDLDRVGREASQARDLGYVGKLCVHPSQVPVVNEVFLSNADDVASARGVVDQA